MRRSLAQRMRQYQPQREANLVPPVEGRLTRVVGMTLEAVGCNVSLGGRCSVTDGHGREIETEVVGFDGPRIYLMPLTSIEGLQPGARVLPMARGEHLAVGPALLGRVLNGLGEPIDGKGDVPLHDIMEHGPVVHKTINPLQRQPIREPLDVGIATINALLTVGRGQRLGLFAGSGVGKSVLLGMMTQFTTADVIVVGLIGERGREVKEFIDEILGQAGLSRAVVVASPADDSPLLRMRAAVLTTRIAEGFREQGKNVLMLMDSLTRFAMAQREIALSIGEPPATKGYPPSVFAKLPQLVERAGNADQGQGSITAFYTVLTEGDDQQDPVADAARAILDGHIVLSRSLAEEGHYPAIDIEASISRVMPSVVSADQFAKMQLFRRIYARYQQNRDLISVGAYVPGSDKDIDFAIERMPHLRQFMQQGLKEKVSFEDALQRLGKVVVPAPRPGNQNNNNVTPLQSRTLNHGGGQAARA
ncbi:MAG: flagellar protein export ATPase FliI [Pseudomonadales bacterium]|nr:flagellar protein export ATPase FliI [Pseudomonadales bacterium]MCP5358183.1 flagellar protein export ATPase FliI [Pseudomonadales bacterium]